MKISKELKIFLGANKRLIEERRYAELFDKAAFDNFDLDTLLTVLDSAAIDWKGIYIPDKTQPHYLRILINKLLIDTKKSPAKQLHYKSLTYLNDIIAYTYVAKFKEHLHVVLNVKVPTSIILDINDIDGDNMERFMFHSVDELVEYLQANDVGVLSDIAPKIKQYI